MDNHMEQAYCHLLCAPLRAGDSDRAEIVSQVIFGELVSVLEKPAKNWWKVRCAHDGYEGFIDPKQLTPVDQKQAKEWKHSKRYRFSGHSAWVVGSKGKQLIPFCALLPIHSGEEFTIASDTFRWLDSQTQDSKPEVLSLAMQYLNTSYLWGGRTPFGVDCSGFTQTVFACVGKDLPRDAYQQAEEGREIDFEKQQPGDLVFFENSKGRIYHVGIVLEFGKVIHSSGQVRIDQLTPEGIQHPKLGLTHPYKYIKRI